MPLWPAGVRAHEKRVATGAFLLLFGIFAAYTVLETARDALFLARLPPSQLPWVYLLMAVVAIVLAQFPSRGFSRLSGAASLTLLLNFLGLVTLSFWIFGSWKSPWPLRALYVWTGTVGTLAGLQFWLVLGEIYTITEAKRVYRIIGTGSLVGAVAGASVAGLISSRFGAPHLLLAASALLIATGSSSTFLLRGAKVQSAAPAGEPPTWSLRHAQALFEREPYLTRLAGFVLVSTIVVTLGDYVFKAAVARTLGPSDLGTFFAAFYMLLNALALGVQWLLIGWVMRTLGVHRSLVVLPVLLFLGAGGVVLGGGLVAALVLKGADGALRPSLHRTGTELLFLPLPDALRARVKPVIDVVGQRGGQAIASVFILAEATMHRNDRVLAGAAAILCVVWIASTADLQPHYVELFRRALREGRLQSRGELPELDLASLESLFGALNSRDDAEVVAALDLLAEEGRVGLIPALILYHPSGTVVLRALELFETSGRTDFVQIADRLLNESGPEVRAAALRARSAVRPQEAVLRAALADPSPVVQATAAVGLVAGGWPAEDAHAALGRLLADTSGVPRRALAAAIERQPAPVFEPTLLALSYESDPAVLVATAQAFGKLRNESALPALLAMLRSEATRSAARRAFVELGADGLRFLREALADSSLPQDLRRHIPRTISRFPPVEAAAVLLDRLLAEDDGMVRFKILRGLGHVATHNPAVPLDPAILRTATERTLEAAFRLIRWRQVCEDGARADPRRVTPGHSLLVALFRDKEAHASERIFRLLGLQHRSEDFADIHRGLRNMNAKVRASSRELIENLVRPPLRDAVLALADGRLPSGNPSPAPAALGYEDLLASLLEQPGETLRCLAAHHVGELRLRALRGRIEELRGKETALFVGRVFERTLRELADPVSGAASP